MSPASILEYRTRLAAVQRRREEKAEAAGWMADASILDDEDYDKALGDRIGGQYSRSGKSSRPKPSICRPRCTERVLAAAHRTAQPGERVVLAGIARNIGVPVSSVERAAIYLKSRGDWPFIVSRRRYPKE